MKYETIRDDGLLANFYRPATGDPRPGIIVIGGAGGGLDSASAVAALLAERGYAALALAYFGLEHLPARLEEIPLEYFKTAIDWMWSQPSVTRDKTGIVGTSKGGEAALLIGAMYKEIGAVAAYSPSSVVFQGITEAWSDSSTSKSSWTLRGKPLPFVPFRLDDKCLERYGFYLGLYLGSLRNTAAVKRAAIPVERINGPVLLATGTDDAIWPSTAMCHQIVERLRQQRFAFSFEHLSYEGAGHLLAGPNSLSPSRTVGANGVNVGGTESANAAARNDAWQKVCAFFGAYLK
ncbi:MAG TPA: acyl-CoA thioester hydrolase/BAAT C-terminal domain-containing protein [Candidatus Bathyarchaeia archaeon]|nr:acyl-CoA thioester hydrolase/BAAT C-terminal domain-containing protein [Candidatus Bathyarchaeia archaeon]